jgi:hypothetical protein
MYLIGITPKALSWVIGLEKSMVEPQSSVLIIDFDFFTPFNFKKKRTIKYFVDQNKNTYLNIYKSFSLKELAKYFKLSLKFKEILFGETINDHAFSQLEKTILATLRSIYAPIHGTRNVDFRSISSSHITQLAFHVYISFHLINKLIESDLKIDMYSICGARDAFGSGSILAIRNHNIKYQITESGAANNRWSHWSRSPHSAVDWWDKVHAHKPIDLNSSQNKIWWQEKLRGYDTFTGIDWSSTTNKNSIPSNLPEIYISYFSTSDYEIPIFEDFEFKGPNFYNQFEAVRMLAKVCKSNKIKLVIRRHPNSVSATKQDLEETLWRDFRLDEDVIYISPFEKYDSLAIAKKSKFLFVYESSIGVEGLKLGVPSYALGGAIWAFDEQFRAWSEEKIRNILLGKVSQDPETIEKWASMMVDFGDEFKHFSFANSRYAILNEQKITTQEFKFRIFNKFFFLFLRFI